MPAIATRGFLWYSAIDSAALIAPDLVEFVIGRCSVPAWFAGWCSMSPLPDLKVVHADLLTGLRSWHKHKFGLHRLVNQFTETVADTLGNFLGSAPEQVEEAQTIAAGLESVRKFSLEVWIHELLLYRLGLRPAWAR
jgi:hypothetical protein